MACRKVFTGVFAPARLPCWNLVQRSVRREGGARAVPLAGASRCGCSVLTARRPPGAGATFLRGFVPTESLYFIYGVCDFGSRKKKGRKLLCFSPCAAANRPRPQACDAQVVNIIGQQGPWWGHSRVLSPPCAILSPPAPAARGKSNPTAPAAAGEEETAENLGGHVRAAAASAPRPRRHWVKRLLFWGKKDFWKGGQDLCMVAGEKVAIGQVAAGITALHVGP